MDFVFRPCLCTGDFVLFILLGNYASLSGYVMSKKSKTDAKADPTIAFRGTISSLDSMLKRVARIHRVRYTGKLWTPVDYHQDDPAHYSGCDIVLTTDE